VKQQAASRNCGKKTYMYTADIVILGSILVMSIMILENAKMQTYYFVV
jgi:hypothetical protein